eukprot:TRINITY_DN16217_c0_g1_i1.p1 TRINITY_DN16217_c0_g1~~TRINITY_DN16217_c0_g1_i1.p1  ORF type:complete len:104 (-),score=24.67 TRINITY_DN16217_c0_g1_i1:200-466(-)
MSFTVMMVGVVNLIICILPVIIGVCAGKKKEVFVAFSILFFIIAVPNLVFLGYVFGWAVLNMIGFNFQNDTNPSAMKWEEFIYVTSSS